MVTYLILSMGLVMFNKWMYIAEGGDFPYPLTLCFLNLLSTTSFLHVAMILFPSVMPSSDYEASPMKTSPMQVFINASVPGFFLVMAMGYGNISMVSLSVAFTTMLKAAKPASVFLVCLVFGIEKFDLARVGIVCGLCITAFCCVWGQSDLHGKASLIYYVYKLVGRLPLGIVEVVGLHAELGPDDRSPCIHANRKRPHLASNIGPRVVYRVGRNNARTKI